MIKYAKMQVMSAVLAPLGMNREARRAFSHRHRFDYTVRPGFLYVRSRAISSRCNDNFDEFPAEELEKSYRTFLGKPVFVNHNNENHKRARGVIIDAALHKDSNADGSKDWWVELLHEVDAVRFPKLAQEILNGNIARTSMGCDVSHSICSACGNKATTPAEYCQHIPASKGQRLYRTTASGHKEGILIRETCYGLKFFENSLLVEPPADPTAHFLGVDASGLDKTAAHRTAFFFDEAKDPRFTEVGMGEDEDGHYVKTHRARSDSYETPEDIPQSEVDRIAATGGLIRMFAARSRTPGEGQQELFDASPLHVDRSEPSKAGTWSAKDSPIDYDEIGRRWPQHYGDPEVHGVDASPDGPAIGEAANYLAHATPSDPGGDNHHVSELEFHSERVHPSKIDYQRQDRYDGRVSHAREGYRDRPDDVPPVVLVHRHGVYQVADGHHRAQAAHLEGKTVRAYVAHSPFPHEPSGDGDMAPYHGAQPSPGRIASLTELMQMEAAARLPSEPSEHPWFKTAGLSHHHIIDAWNDATPEEKAQGARWYPDAHHVAKAIAKLNPDIKDDKEAAHKGAGVLSAYSPQQGWWANQHNAARSFINKKAVGKGEGIMVMGSHATAAQKILDGEDHQSALKGPKTQDFAHLIEHGGNDEEGKPSKRVVMDRHALSVAAGRRLNADDVKGFPSSSRKHYEHAAETYRTAAAVLSDREGRTIPPHEVQAVTWLGQQRRNATGESTPGQKGRDTVQRNQKEQWKGLTREHTPQLHAEPPNSHVSKKAAR